MLHISGSAVQHWAPESCMCPTFSCTSQNHFFFSTNCLVELGAPFQALTFHFEGLHKLQDCFPIWPKKGQKMRKLSKNGPVNSFFQTFFSTVCSHWVVDENEQKFGLLGTFAGAEYCSPIFRKIWTRRLRNFGRTNNFSGGTRHTVEAFDTRLCFKFYSVWTNSHLDKSKLLLLDIWSHPLYFNYTHQAKTAQLHS